MLHSLIAGAGMVKEVAESGLMSPSQAAKLRGANRLCSRRGASAVCGSCGPRCREWRCWGGSGKASASGRSSGTGSSTPTAAVAAMGDEGRAEGQERGDWREEEDPLGLRGQGATESVTLRGVFSPVSAAAGRAGVEGWLVGGMETTVLVRLRVQTASGATVADDVADDCCCDTRGRLVGGCCAATAQAAGPKRRFRQVMQQDAHTVQSDAVSLENRDTGTGRWASRPLVAGEGMTAAEGHPRTWGEEDVGIRAELPAAKPGSRRAVGTAEQRCNVQDAVLAARC